MERLVEICCGSYEDALNAYYGRAKRIDLIMLSHLGGLTPSLRFFETYKKEYKFKSYYNGKTKKVQDFVITILNLKL